MKFIVDEMPSYRYDCPFNKRDSRTGEDFCKCGETVYDCAYFTMGRDPYYCNWLKEKDDE